LSLACLILALLPSAPRGEALPTAPRFALVIGNAGYTAAVGALKNPLNDASDMCAALGALGFKTSCFVNVASRVQLRSLIQDFVDSLPDNAVTFVYYAGHAIQVAGENYLIPTTAQLQAPSTVDKESVTLSFLMREIRQTQNYLNLIVLDACRTNPWGSSAAGFTPGLAQVTDAPARSVVFYATADDDVAADGTGRNGILTKNILASIREPGTIQDLFNHVGEGVRKDAEALGRQQQPALYTTFAGQFCLVKCSEAEDLQSRVAQLQAQVAAGDKSHQAELDAANAALRKLESQSVAKEKAARERQRKEFVPPAF
jgi:uncharacterized caspase-like protein